MGGDDQWQNLELVMITFVEACDRVLRFLRLSSASANAQIHSSKDDGTHWLITYAVPSLEDPSRIFMYASVVVEIDTGHVFCPPSRGPKVDVTLLNSIRKHWGRLTIADMESLEKECEAKQ
jgi:hypothetical protein